MSTVTVTINDMQQRLPEFLAMVSKGNTIIIEKDKKPFARLIGIGTRKKKRTAGLNQDEILVSDDFDAPLPDEFWVTGK